MSEIDNEKAILEETPDFDNQAKILEEEHKEEVKKRNWYILIFSIVLLIVLIFVVSFSTIYHYHEYYDKHSIRCDDVNIKIDGSLVPNINVTEGKKCLPKYNIDYEGNRIAIFNIDLYGDRSELFNKVNQLDSSKKYCVLNCDRNEDGWPDYNLDINGDGKADINIVKNPKKSDGTCELNCDLNYDMIPDINIDIDGDGKADINITEGNNAIPKYNIDYKGNRTPTFNVKSGNQITNPVTDASTVQSCEKNCDIDGDGWPDYNIVLTEDAEMINVLVEKGNSQTRFDKSKYIDWKCTVDSVLNTCKDYVMVPGNTYINIDVDGDGKADVNISDDNGKTVTNPIENKINGVWINIDKNKDGFPDYNIDVDNDGNPDMNIIDNNKYKCVKNCDTNNDGKPEYLTQYGDNQITYKNLNIDVDYDGRCDINCDVNYDLVPDINLDSNGDNIADTNIDFNYDGTVDFNVDDNFNAVPTEKLDAYGTGVCNFNCDGKNLVSSDANCTSNCDTDYDGWPDKNVDVDNDGICDFNCDNGTTNIDKDNNYYLDSEYKYNAILDITNGVDADFYIMNPLEIKSDSIEPGWNDKYVIRIKNNTNYAAAYRVVWEKVYNEFTYINNLDYNLYRSNTEYLKDLKAPRTRTILKDGQIIRGNSSAEFVLDIYFRETGLNQNIDSGKTFKGQLKIELIK